MRYDDRNTQVPLQHDEHPHSFRYVWSRALDVQSEDLHFRWPSGVGHNDRFGQSCKRGSTQQRGRTVTGFGVDAIADRPEATRKLERDSATSEHYLRNESQLNRKVELRRTLKTKQTTLVDLTGPTH
jgi:hypothetical protein